MLLRLTARSETDKYGNVLVDGQVLSPVRSLRVINHSPTGFAWGYAGSGPAQLAVALLLEAGVPDDLALHLHQDFKSEYVAGWPSDPPPGEFLIDPATWAYDRLVELAQAELANLLRPDVASPFLVAVLRATWMTELERGALGSLAHAVENVVTLAEARP